MKYYVGLDVSLKEVSICVVDADGVVAAEGKVATEPALILSWIEERIGAVERRFVMHDDSDIGTKPARAIGNAIISSVIGDTMNYVSGGEVDSHSGPPDGNPVSAIIRA